MHVLLLGHVHRVGEGRGEGRQEPVENPAEVSLGAQVRGREEVDVVSSGA